MKLTNYNYRDYTIEKENFQFIIEQDMLSNNFIAYMRIGNKLVAKKINRNEDINIEQLHTTLHELIKKERK